MEDWKNDRAEADIKAHEKEMMQKAVERKKQEEDKKWDDLKKSLYLGDSEDDKFISMTIDLLREQYELPIERKIKE